MHFQSTSMNEKKNPAVEVLSTNWFLPVPSIHLNFPITKQTFNRNFRNVYFFFPKKTHVKGRTLRTF